MDKKEGDLGVRKLFFLNKALLGKWYWRFASKNDSFWKQVVIGKYREDEGVGVLELRYGWKGFNNKIGFRVGNGKKVRFWKDMWCGEEPLAMTSPELFSIATNKEAWVDQMWKQVGEVGC